MGFISWYYCALSGSMQLGFPWVYRHTSYLTLVKIASVIVFHCNYARSIYYILLNQLTMPIGYLPPVLTPTFLHLSVVQVQVRVVLADLGTL